MKDFLVRTKRGGIWFKVIMAEDAIHAAILCASYSPYGVR